MFGFARSAGDDGIHGAAGFGRHFFDAQPGNDVFDGIGTAFPKRHVVFFGAAFVAVPDDLDRIDVAARFDAICVRFDRRFGVGTDGCFVEIEIGDAHLADGRIDAMFIFADFPVRAIFIDEAFGLGHATVVFAQVILGAIFRDGFGIAFGTASAVAAFLTCGAIYADFGIAIPVDALTRTAVANVAFIAFARAMFVVSAFGAFCVEAVFVCRFSAFFGGAVVIFVAFGVGRRTSACQTHHKTDRSRDQ